VRDQSSVEVGAEEVNFAGHEDGNLRSAKQEATLALGLVEQEVLAMKSAYELAMERLEKKAPSVALTQEQKEQIAEIDSSYRAKIAEKELFLKDQIRKAQMEGKFDEAESLEKQRAIEVRRLQEDCEEKKEKLRAQFAK
jgi:hypothetical protein